MLVSASSGPFASRSAVYRAPAVGGRFERCSDGLPEWFDGNVDSHCLAARDDEAFIGSSTGNVHRSRDGGRSWHTIAEGLPSIRAIATLPAGTS